MNPRMIVRKIGTPGNVRFARDCHKHHRESKVEGMEPKNELHSTLAMRPIQCTARFTFLSVFGPYFRLDGALCTARLLPNSVFASCLRIPRLLHARLLTLSTPGI